MKRRLIYPALLVLALTCLLSGCRTETLAPDTEEREPLFLRGFVGTDSFLFTNESNDMYAECRTELVRDTIKKFVFSFIDKRPRGRKIEISFLANTAGQNPTVDSAIVRGDYEFTDRGNGTTRIVEIAWYEDGASYSTGNVFQPGIFKVTLVEDIYWDGVRYKRLQITGLCTLTDSLGTSRQITDLTGQIVIRDDR
jgi:hypothetical protein